MFFFFVELYFSYFEWIWTVLICWFELEGLSFTPKQMCFFTEKKKEKDYAVNK